jgi:hypothetical protein
MAEEEGEAFGVRHVIRNAGVDVDLAQHIQFSQSERPILMFGSPFQRLKDFLRKQQALIRDPI